MQTIGKIQRPPIYVLLLTFGLVTLSAFKGAAAGQKTEIVAEVNGVPIERRSFQIIIHE